MGLNVHCHWVLLVQLPRCSNLAIKAPHPVVGDWSVDAVAAERYSPHQVKRHNAKVVRP
jgi:hypothetical protein